MVLRDGSQPWMVTTVGLCCIRPRELARKSHRSYVTITITTQLKHIHKGLVDYRLSYEIGQAYKNHKPGDGLLHVSSGDVP